MCAHGAPRLARIYGRSPRFVFLTICTRERLPLLSPNGFGTIVRDRFLQSAACLDIEVYAYAVLKDHVHLLVRISPAAIDRFVRRWKQATGYDWKRRGNPHRLWQRGFYDRVLRLDEDPRRVAKYIVGDAVRTDLVTRPEDHPLTFCAVPL